MLISNIFLCILQTITETITVTHTVGEEDKRLLEEKDNKIEELRQVRDYN